MRSCTSAVAPLLIGMVALASCVETRVPVGKPPLIEFGSIEYDAGRVRQGERIEKTFVFRNAGQRDLRVSRVRASCDCTVAGPGALVPPGQTGEIVASFDTTGLAGEVTRTAAVFSNDPSAPVVHLKLKASIDFDIAATPRSFYVGSVDPGEEVRMQGRLAVARGDEVVRIESPGPVVAAWLVEPTMDSVPEDVRRYRVRIRDEAPGGAFTENVIVHTSSQRTPTLSIAVVGVVEEDA